MSLLNAAILGPIMYTACLLAMISMFYGSQIIEGGEEAITAVTLVASGALLLLNLHVFLLGWPLYTDLKKRNKLHLRYLLPAAFIACATTSLLISIYLKTTNYWQIGIQTLIYGLSGMIVTYLIWRLGIKK